MSNKEPAFAQAFEELESLSREFESGQLDLEKAIPKFKKAAELAKFLKKRLSELENQIEEINLDLTDPEPEPPPEKPPVSPDEETQDIPF